MKGLDYLYPLVLLALVAGCVSRMPLDSVVASSPINGQIMVTVLNGLTTTAGVFVQCVGPNGVMQTVSSTSATQATQGQVIFTEKWTGTYLISVANQPAQNPNIVKVTLTTGQPYNACNLQISTGFVQVASGDGYPLSYDDTSAYHTFKLTYVNTTNLQQDCTLVYNGLQSNLPKGWSVFFNTAVIQAGQSTSLIVQTAPLSIGGNVTITVNALVNSRPIIVAPLVLTQAWVPLIQWTHTNSGNCSNWNLYLNFICFKCANPGNTLSETDSYSGPDTTQEVGVQNPNVGKPCAGNGAVLTLTDALSVPDGNGPEFNNNVYCEPTSTVLTIDCRSTFPNGLEYGFVPPIGCAGLSGYVTLTAAMLGQ